jgi:phosphate-selective porin OprO and OprP
MSLAARRPTVATVQAFLVLLAVGAAASGAGAQDERSDEPADGASAAHGETAAARAGEPSRREGAEELTDRPRALALRKLEVLPGAMARGTGKVEGRAIWMGTPDKRFIFRFSGFVHMDMRYAGGLGEEGRDFEVIPLARRARFAAEGTTFGELDYRIMFDPAVDVYPLDAYLDWRPLAEVNLRVGKFKSPFGFERRARAFSLVFNERGFPTLLAPNRDFGAFLHGQTVDGFFSYDVAALGGAADMESIHMLRGSPEAAGRIYLQPFRLVDLADALRHFGVGASFTYGTEDGSAGDPRVGALQTTGRDRFFRYRDGSDDGPIAYADGQRRRWSLHGHWRHGRVNTLWEYIRSEQHVTAETTSRTAANEAFQIYAGMALTDDEWGFFGIVPRRPFDPSRGSFGAVALAARYHQISMDPGIFPELADPDAAAQGARAGSLSLQWVHNENLGGQLDFETVFFEGGAPGGLNRPTELNVAFRIQAFY